MVVATVLSERDAWAARCLHSNTRRLQRSHTQRDVRLLVISMLTGMVTGGDTRSSTVSSPEISPSDARLLTDESVEGYLQIVPSVLQMDQGSPHQSARADNGAQFPAAPSGQRDSSGLSRVPCVRLIGSEVCVRNQGLHPQS